nr:putative ribosomal pseudouridine synthase [Campylobacter jejuni subsp. jejuni CG8421]
MVFSISSILAISNFAFLRIFSQSVSLMRPSLFQAFTAANSTFNHASYFACMSHFLAMISLLYLSTIFETFLAIILYFKNRNYIKLS